MTEDTSLTKSHTLSFVPTEVPQLTWSGALDIYDPWHRDLFSWLNLKLNYRVIT